MITDRQFSPERSCEPPESLHEPWYITVLSLSKQRNGTYSLEPTADQNPKNNLRSLHKSNSSHPTQPGTVPVDCEYLLALCNEDSKVLVQRSDGNW
jgi:hypothetical protein